MRRSLVPDTSVLVSALFGGVEARPARRLYDAIFDGRVRAFASPTLSVEFLKVAASFRSGREGRSRRDAEDVALVVEDYFGLPLRPVHDEEVRGEVWRLIEEERVSPPDAWMLATAIHTDGELWLTHDHADGFVVAARRLHPLVFTLAEGRGDLP